MDLNLLMISSKTIAHNIQVIHSPIKHELNACSILSTVVDPGHTAVTKTNRIYILRKEQQ